MGNCSGIFANCTGEDNASNSVRRIDAAEMKRALAQNEINQDCQINYDGHHPKGEDANFYNHTRNNPNAMIDMNHPENKDMEMRQGIREVKNPIHLDSGAVYEGEWLNNVRDGEGKQEWLDGSRYEG